MSIYFSDSFWLFLSTFEHKYLNFLLVTLVWMLLSFWLRMLYQHKMSLFDILGMRLNSQLISWCVQEQLGQNPTDSAFKFNSLCIILIWREVSQLCTEMFFRGKLLTLILWVHFTICTSLLLTFNFCPLAVASMRSYTYLKSDSTHTHRITLLDLFFGFIRHLKNKQTNKKTQRRWTSVGLRLSSSAGRGIGGRSSHSQQPYCHRGHKEWSKFN